MNLLQRDVVIEQSQPLVPLVEGGHRQRGQQHELGEVRLELDQEIDIFLDVLGCVVLHAQDAGGQDPDPTVAAAAADTFRDVARPIMGRRTVTSAPSRSSGDSPWRSLPSRRTTGWR